MGKSNFEVPVSTVSQTTEQAGKVSQVVGSTTVSLYDQVRKVVRYFNDHSLKSETTKVYRNKVNPSDSFESTDAELAAAFKAGKSLTDYELVEEVINHQQILLKAIFGREKQPAFFDKKLVSRFVEVCEAVITVPKEEEVKAKAKAKQKVYNVANAVKKGEKTEDDLKEAIAEAVVVYAKYGEDYNYTPDSRKGKKSATLDEASTKNNN